MIREEIVRKVSRSMAVLCLTAGIASTALPAFASERQVIPFSMTEETHMMVEMDVNDGAMVMGIIDTAATFPMIDGRTAQAAGVSDPGENPTLVNVLGVGGRELFPVVELERIVVGNVAKADLLVALNTRLDNPGMKNVLPVNALEGDVIDFDFEKKRVLVYNGRPDRIRHMVPSSQKIEVENGLLFIEVRVNGKKGRALIDTGSTVSYINNVFAEEAGTVSNRERTQALWGVTGGEHDLRIATARTLQFGDYRVSKVDILVTNPPLFEYLNLGEEPAMVMGLDLLSSFWMQIDRRRNRLILSLPDTGGITRNLNLNARDTRIPEY